MHPNCKKFISQLRKHLSHLRIFIANKESVLEAALQERCDGNRNIIHACVSRSFPVSAHEPGETTESQLNSGSSTTNGALGNKLESIKGAVDALAAAVAAAAAAVRSSGKGSWYAATLRLRLTKI